MIVAVIVRAALDGGAAVPAVAGAVARRRGGSQPQGDLVGPAALLAAEPHLCPRPEHAPGREFIDPSLPTATVPYSLSVADASDSWFTATATRSGSSSWTGSFTIAADGTFSGSVQQSGQGVSLEPGFQ